MPHKCMSNNECYAQKWERGEVVSSCPRDIHMRMGGHLLGMLPKGSGHWEGLGYKDEGFVQSFPGPRSGDSQAASLPE